MPALDVVAQTIERITEDAARYANRVNGESISAVFQGVINAGANDYISHVLNTGAVAIEIIGLTIFASAANDYRLDHVTGIAGGSPTLGVNASKRVFLNAGGVDVTVNNDPDITGLTAVGDGLDIFGLIADQEVTHKYAGSIILDPGDAVALLSVVTTITTGGVWHIITHPESNVSV